MKMKLTERGKAFGDMAETCDALIKRELAEKVSETAIRFTGDIDLNKLAQLERSYGEAFHRRWLEDDAKEREAEKKFHDFVITY